MRVCTGKNRIGVVVIGCLQVIGSIFVQKQQLRKRFVLVGVYFVPLYSIDKSNFSLTPRTYMSFSFLRLIL